MTAAKQLAVRALAGLGLLDTAASTYLRLVYLRQLPFRQRAASTDGLPLPPPGLIFAVARTPSERWYLDSGAAAAGSIRASLARHGASVEQAGALLDFGCGCGRVLRHWAGLPVEAHGSDLNGRAIAWCRDALPFARVGTNGLAPPLDQPDGRFGLVYALSVLTHLPEELGEAWLRELVRVLRPGGHLLLTLHGERYLDRLTGPEQARFRAGELVVRRPGIAGSNLCTVFHPEQYVRERLAAGLELLELVPGGAAGNPVQDLVLLRKPG